MPRLPAAIAVGLLLALGAASSAFAHGEETLELGADRVRPGGSLEVRGDLGSGAAFDITLIAVDDLSRRLLTTVAASEEGHVQAYITIPLDVPAGDYLIEVTNDVTVMRSALTVAGAPVAGEEGQLTGRDEGLGIVPTAATGIPGTGATAAPAVVAPVHTEGSPLASLAILTLATGLAAASLIALRLVGRRRSAGS